MAYRSRRRGFVASAVVAGLFLAAHNSNATAVHGAPGKVAAQAIAYAQRQIGLPYLWGGTGPGGFDCSGLVMEAYASAGVHIARTSQDQWATEPHMSSPQPGDLVFYAGADGTQTSPGHVAIVVASGRMVEAYATGYPIREVPIRPGMVGYTQPGGA